MTGDHDDAPIEGEIVGAGLVPDGVTAPTDAEPGFSLGGGLDLGAMVQMAQDMGQRMQEAQERLESTQVTGTAGGGIVEVTLNGHLHLVAVHIDPSAMDREDPTMLEDLVAAAWADARDGVARLQREADPLGGLGDLGGLGGLLGGT